MAFLDPWQADTSSPRTLQGVVRHASFSELTRWTTLNRGAVGDARASSADSLAVEFLGDYDDIAATNTQAVAVWSLYTIKLDLFYWSIKVISIPI